MAFIFRKGSILVTVKVRDHTPAHVHVEDGKHETKVNISSDELAIAYIGKKKRIKTTASFDKLALELVAENLELCRAAWRKYHGEL